MHYTTAYKSHSREDNTLRAIDDNAFYLGARFDETIELMRDAIPQDARLADKFRAVEFMCRLVGIRGRYPVRAMAVLVLHPPFEPMMLRKQAH